MSVIVAAVVVAAIGGAAVLAWIVGGPRDRPFDPSSPVRVVVLVYLVMYGIGSIAIAASGEATAGPLMVAAAFVALATGVWIGTLTLGRVRAFGPGMVEGEIRLLAVAVLAGIGIAGYAGLVVRYGIPLLSDNPVTARAGYAGVALDLFRWFVPPATIVAFGVGLVRRSRRRVAVATALIAAVIALETLVGSRALPLELLLALLLLVLWARGRLPVRAWGALAVVVAVLFVGVLFARVAQGLSFRDTAAAIDFATNRTVGRIVLIHPRTIEVVVDTFPQEQNYLAGATYVRWLGPLTGGERSESLGSILFRKLFPGEPPGGFAAPGIFGEAWANGGPILALLMMAAIGIAAAGLSRLGLLLGPGVVDRTFLAILTVALARSYASSLNGLLLTVAASTAWWLVSSGRLQSLAARFVRDAARRGAGRSASANRPLDDDPSSLLP